MRKNMNTRKSLNNRQLKSKRSKIRNYKGGNQTQIHILYVLGTKNQQNQLQVVAMSKSIRNLHMFAKDLPENLLYPDSRNQAILESSMAIDTIELNNLNTSHNWQHVSLQEIDSKISSGIYDGSIEDIAEVLLYYTLDRSSPITGVVGAVYSNDVPGSDGQMMTEFGNFSDALSLLNNYEPMELKVDVLDHKLSVNSPSKALRERLDSGKATIKSLKSDGYKIDKFKNIGISPLELYNGGYTLEELLLYYTIPELIEGGLSYKELRRDRKALQPYFKLLNLKPSDLIEQGYKNELKYYFNMKELYDSGMTVNEIKELYSPQRMDKLEWYTDDRYVLPALAKFLKPTQLRGDYVPEDISKYYTPKQLYEDGFSIKDLKTIYSENIIQKLSTFMTAQQIWDLAREIAAENDWYIYNKQKDNYRAVNRNPEVIQSDLINWFSREEILKLRLDKNLLDIVIKGKIPDITLGDLLLQYTDNIPELLKNEFTIEYLLETGLFSIDVLKPYIKLNQNLINLVSKRYKIPNLTLKDLILQYRDNIPELLKFFTPGYLFETGLFSYGELKPYIKEEHDKSSYLELTKDCKKNWKRQTNLDCKYIPDKGRVVNETERYP